MAEIIVAILLMIGAAHALISQRRIGSILKVYTLMLSPTLAAFLFIAMGMPLWVTQTAIAIGTIPGIIAAGGLIALFIHACITNYENDKPIKNKGKMPWCVKMSIYEGFKL